MRSGAYIVMFALGILTGAGVTYLYMDKKKDEEVSQAVHEVREEYESIEKNKEIEESSEDEPLKESTKRFDELLEIKREHERQRQENGTTFVDYSKISQEIQNLDKDVTEEALEENAENNERIAQAQEMAEESMKPFTTDVNTYCEAFTEHTKDTATYYIRDDTLIDSAGDEADLDYLVGRWNIDNFINGPYNEATNDTLYIINPSNSIDLEIQVVDDVSHDPAADGD